MDVPLDALIGIFAVIGTVVSVWGVIKRESRESHSRFERMMQTVREQIEQHSLRSEERTKRIHDRLDEQHRDLEHQIKTMRDETAATYVRRDVHERDMKTVHQMTEEQQQVLNALAGRVCPIDTKQDQSR